MKAGLYGAGAFAGFIAQTMAQRGPLRVAAISSRTPAHAREFGAKHGIGRVCESYEAMLALDDIEAVIVASPPSDHAPKALAAIAAGKHVFVEKPLATEVDAARSVVDAAVRAGKIVGVDFPMPYTPIVRAIGAIAASGAAGELQSIAVENIASCEGLPDDHWFWDPAVSGGILIEHGVHFFDWCGALLGVPREAIAWVGGTPKRQDRVFAAIGADRSKLATYYHAFIASSAEERTHAVACFDGCDAIADGWIPTRLRLTGRRAKAAADAVRALRSPGLQERSVGGEAWFDAGEKQRLYADGIAAVAEDFCAAVSDPNHRRIVDARRAFEAVRVAAAFRAAARSGQSQAL